MIAAGADRIHFDVMDNHDVPNLSIGLAVFEALKPWVRKADGSPIPKDVHLMCTRSSTSGTAAFGWPWTAA